MLAQYFCTGFSTFSTAEYSPVLVYHTDTVRIFHGEIDVLEYPFPFASRAKGIDRNGHAYANGNKNQEDVCNHSVIYN